MTVSGVIPCPFTLSFHLLGIMMGCSGISVLGHICLSAYLHGSFRERRTNPDSSCVCVCVRASLETRREEWISPDYWLFWFFRACPVHPVTCPWPVPWSLSWSYSVFGTGLVPRWSVHSMDHALPWIQVRRCAVWGRPSPCTSWHFSAQDRQVVHALAWVDLIVELAWLVVLLF